MSLLWHRDFRLLWFGETVSQLGTAVATVAMPLVSVTVLHASTFTVTALVAMSWLPWLLIGLPAGAWVDRLPCRAVMVICDLIAVMAYASVPAASWLGVLPVGLRAHRTAADQASGHRPGLNPDLPATGRDDRAEALT